MFSFIFHQFLIDFEKSRHNLILRHLRREAVGLHNCLVVGLVGFAKFNRHNDVIV